MALVVEDGTGLDDADSYIALDDAIQMARKYGLSLPSCDDEAEAALRNGALYVDLNEPSFSGDRLENNQALAWPRSSAYKCSGVAIASDSVPVEAQRSQVFAAAEYGAGTDVRPSSSGAEVKKEKVSSIEVEYFETGSNGSVTIKRADDALSMLVCTSTNPYTQRTLRV